MSTPILLCSAGRIRTYDQSLTLILKLLLGVDYIIIISVEKSWDLDVRRFPPDPLIDGNGSTPLRDSL